MTLNMIAEQFRLRLLKEGYSIEEAEKIYSLLVLELLRPEEVPGLVTAYEFNKDESVKSTKIRKATEDEWKLLHR